MNKDIINCRPDPLALPDWKPGFDFRWRDALELFLYVGVVVIFSIEGSIRFEEFWRERYVIVSLAVIGIWRYSWWLLHLIRALIYHFYVFPKIRVRSDRLWAGGWRPEQIIFMVCSYKEQYKVTEKMCLGIIRNLRNLGIPGQIYISGTENDEKQIEAVFRHYAPDDDIKIIFIRQRIPDKRIAIGQLLRSVSRHTPRADVPVVFMDGDTAIAPGCLRKCVPLFELFPDVHALTTHEKAVVEGNMFFQKWFDLRFAQRHMQFQSMALSGKVLTLTGRLSVFRAVKVLSEEFISTIENDSLSHWLWGSFRFLSGDDKSSWYALVKQGARMLYVPDAMAYTMDKVEGNTFFRIWRNTLRWSGNSLRNSGRVIAMGPRKVGLFTWWCLVDQRLSTWTCLSGPLAILGVALVKSPYSALAFVLWIFISRFCFSCVLFFYGGRIDMTFPFLLYFNQLVTASGKMYILFRLPLQRWTNRSDVEYDGAGNLFKHVVAMYITILALSALILFVGLYTRVISFPEWQSVRIMLGM
ncbi:MAG: glycosyltransferase [Victivallales bacterium]|nr:glycosyltransferase [Victivallales bacterium]